MFESDLDNVVAPLDTCEPISKPPMLPWAPTLPMATVEELPLRAQLITKLVKTYALIERIEKDGENLVQKYKFASADAIFDEVRAALNTVGVAFVPVLDRIARELVEHNGKRFLEATGYWIMALVDSETGYSIAVPWQSEVQEYQDKTVGKLATQALKSFLKSFFLIPTGDDPDALSGKDEPSQADHPRPQQASRQNAAPARSVLPPAEPASAGAPQPSKYISLFGVQVSMPPQSSLKQFVDSEQEKIAVQWVGEKTQMPDRAKRDMAALLVSAKVIHANQVMTPPQLSKYGAAIVKRWVDNSTEESIQRLMEFADSLIKPEPPGAPVAKASAEEEYNPFAEE